MDVPIATPASQDCADERGSCARFHAEEWPAMWRLAIVSTGDRTLGEDLAQDAFVQAQRHWRRVSGYDRPDAWVRRVLIHRPRSRWRRLGRARAALERLHARAAPALELSATTSEVWAAVRQLPRRQREVVASVFVEDRTVADASRILGCTEDTARTHLRRALHRLGDLLDVQREEIR
jgi:RNA polymerase sigma-70 factor (ECF subfamily)